MSEYQIVRSITIAADPARVHALINDFHEWTAWSPWEDVDPELNREYSGPTSGRGARYDWNGNRKAGQGSMEITSSDAREIGIQILFLKPWKASNQVTFTLEPVGAATDVTWLMTGDQQGLMKVMGKLFNMEKLVGKDFEKGLARLKAVAETPA